MFWVKFWNNAVIVFQLSVAFYGFSHAWSSHSVVTTLGLTASLLMMWWLGVKYGHGHEFS